MPQRPNILIFCTDEQRGDHLSCMGHPHLRTPNIDRIAAGGTLFRNAYSSNPICMPARATMFTGQTGRVTGVVDNGVSLDPSWPTLPGILRDAGYRTHSVGKLHLQNWGGALAPGETALSNPERRAYWDWPGRREDGIYQHFPNDYFGLQTVELCNGHVHYVYGDYVTWLQKHHPGAYVGYANSNEHPHPLAIDPELHYNTWIADRSISFLEAQASAAEPFFLWCSFPDPHEPFAAVKKWSDAYADTEIDLPQNALELSPDSRCQALTDAGLGTAPIDPDRVRESIRQTCGMVSHVDEQVGRVMDRLDALGLSQNTVVVFISDHGDQLGEHGLFYKSVYPYDAHMHIPFVVKAPEAKQPGKVVEDVVSMLDLMPTVLDLAGVPHPWEGEAGDRPALPGEVLTPVVKGEADPQRKHALVECDRLNVRAGSLQVRTLVTNDFKLVYYPRSGETLLFDRKNDPQERTNRADDPACSEVLQGLLRTLLSELSRTEMSHLARARYR